MEVAGGSGSSTTVDEQLDQDSVNPVQNRAIQAALQQKQDLIPDASQRIEDNEENISALFRMLKALEDKVKSYHPDDPEDPTPFDPLVGTVGEVVINKDPENITVSDIVNALTLTPLADDLPSGMRIYEAAAEGSGETADVYFKPGNTAEAETFNTNLLIDLCKADGVYSDCAGLHLDQVYHIRRDSSSAYDTGIPIEKDFTIDGEVDGVATGGFTTTSKFFYTRHSLNLNKAVFTSTTGQAYYEFFIDTVLGIDQLIVTGCVFHTDYNLGRHFAIAARDVTPFDEYGALRDDNCINDVLFMDNHFEGGATIAHGFSKNSSNFKVYTADEGDIPSLKANVGNPLYKNSLRFINNSVGDPQGTPFTGMAINLCIVNNGGDYNGVKAYASCPLWVAGNTFQGARKVTRGSSYYTALLAEYSRVYFLRNTVRDLVAGHYAYTSGGSTTRTNQNVYDSYASVTQFYCCNNTFHNLVRLTTDRTNFGILKGKGVCVPSDFTAAHMPILRTYIGNTYSINRTEVLTFWQNRVNEYPADTSTIDYSPMRDYDTALDPTIENYLCPKLETGMWSNPADTFIFRNNLIQAPCLEGQYNSGYAAREWYVEDNRFLVSAMKQDYIKYFFSPKRATEMHFRRNVFGAVPSSRFFYIRYNAAEGEPLIELTGNTFPEGTTRLQAWMDVDKGTDHLLRCEGASGLPADRDYTYIPASVDSDAGTTHEPGEAGTAGSIGL